MVNLDDMGELSLMQHGVNRLNIHQPIAAIDCRQDFAGGVRAAEFGNLFRSGAVSGKIHATEQGCLPQAPESLSARSSVTRKSLRSVAATSCCGRLLSPR